jgi:hypothetical protein
MISASLPHGHDAIAAHGQGRGLGPLLVHGRDAAVQQHEVGAESGSRLSLGGVLAAAGPE